jgi:hypothetical protein
MIAKAGKRSFSNYKSAALPTELCRQQRAQCSATISSRQAHSLKTRRPSRAVLLSHKKSNSLIAWEVCSGLADVRFSDYSLSRLVVNRARGDVLGPIKLPGRFPYFGGGVGSLGLGVGDGRAARRRATSG